MKRILIGLLLVSSSLIAQNTWYKTYDLRGDSDAGWSITATEDGYFIDSGSLCFGSSISCIGGIKIDFEGGRIWDYHYDAFPHSIISGSSQAILKTKNGDYLVTGSVHIKDTDWDIFLHKLSSDGDSLWTKYYGKNDDDTGYCIALSHEGGYVIGGYRYDTNKLIKVDTLGNVLLEKEFGDFYANGVKNIHPISGKRYLITCIGRNIGFERQAQILRTDSAFNILWEKTFPPQDGPCDFFRCLPLPNGNYVLSLCKDTIINEGDYPAPYGVIGLDTMGNTLWEYFHSSPYHRIIQTNIRVLSNGDIVGVGREDGGDYPALVYRLNQDGEELWRREYIPAGEEFYSPGLLLYDVTETPDGGLMVAGADIIKNEVFASVDVVLMKLDEHGCLEPGCEDSDDVIYLDIEEGENGILIAQSPYRLQIAPNPTREQISIHYQVPPSSRSAHIHIFDVLGREVQREKVSINDDTFISKILLSGVYFVVLEVEGVFVREEKVVVF